MNSNDFLLTLGYRMLSFKCNPDCDKANAFDIISFDCFTLDYPFRQTALGVDSGRFHYCLKRFSRTNI